MHLVSVSAHAWTLPLHAPFAIARRTATEACNVLITARTENAIGLGESAPVAYVTGETVDTVLASITEVAPLLVGRPLDRLGPLWDTAARVLPNAPAARAGLEMALFDLWARGRNLSGWQFFGGRQTTLKTDITIPLVSATEAAALAHAAWEEGFRTLKLKVGHPDGHAEDLARVEAVVRAFPGARLRVDANQAFEPDGAVRFAEELLRVGAVIELLEQPVHRDDWQGLKSVKDRVSVPVFADEAACTPADVLHLLRQDAVDGVNIKLMKSGLAGAVEIISLCHTANTPLMLGCMLETSLGIAVAAQLAGGTGAFAHLDLDSHRLLAPVPGLTGGFQTTGDTLEVGDTAGSGSGWSVTLAGE